MLILQNNEQEYPTPLEAPCVKCGEPGRLYCRESNMTFSHLSDKCADNDTEALLLVQTVKLGKNLVTVAATNKVTKKDVEAVISPDDEEQSEEA